MPTTTPHHRHDTSSHISGTRNDWRCRNCFKLLGKRFEDRVLLRFGRDHQYDCNTPVTAVCRRCGTLNELRKSN